MLSPVVLAYLVGPVAFGVLLVFRHFGLVHDAPVWAYLVAILVPSAISACVEGWRGAPPGSFRRHFRVFVHVLAVTLVVYLSGWGPVLGMAYAFVALEELQESGSGLWRAMLGWSLLNIAVGQWFVWAGWAPSFLTRSQSMTVAALGAFVLAIIVRMAGATGATKEEAERQLAHQARHDALTGLPNRACFYERTARALELAAARQTLSAVLLFDLDRFKEINDTMGHRYGDQVLIEVGPRVRSVLRDGDVVARLGGDEFCVLVTGVGTDHDPVRVAERIITALEQPIQIEGATLGIEASCGIALFPTDGHNADLLLQRADLAMYAAKSSAHHVVVYSDDLSPKAASLTLLGELRNAVGREEFVLHYQPKADMTTRRVLGVEALIRWQHPERGLLGPDQFIPEAERTGVIEPLTHWVLDTALRQCRAWADDAVRQGRPPLSVAVNLSTRSLLDLSLPEQVGAVLDRWGVPPELLELEITETVIMSDPVQSRRVLTELAQMGIHLAIDDFGTGYSSLAKLRELPVSQLKIDREFVMDMGTDVDDAVIVRSVVDLAGNLGLETVAEGVEDEETWEQLRALGCDCAQGYLLARPMDADAFDAWRVDHDRLLAEREREASERGARLAATAPGPLTAVLH